MQEELRKYDGLKADIRTNVDRQAELLGVLRQQQAAFRSAFGFADWRRACEVQINPLTSPPCVLVRIHRVGCWLASLHRVLWVQMADTVAWC